MHSTNIFVARVLASLPDPIPTTDFGHPQPILFEALYAERDRSTGTPPNSLPAEFYSEATVALRPRGYVVFPCSMYSPNDVCVMDRELFLGIRRGSVVDDEAKITLEHCPRPELLPLITELAEVEEGRDERLH